MRKKFFYVAIAALMCAGMPIHAQSGKQKCDKTAGCEGKGKQRVERLVKELNLQGDAKESFTKLYALYQEEMKAACPEKKNKDAVGKRKKSDKKAELTAEEATRRMQGRFEREARRIEVQSKRLEIKKKYYAEFGKILSPEQLCKVFAPRHGNHRPAGSHQKGNHPKGKRPGRPGGQHGGPRGNFGSMQRK
ncbi:MAG: hypothetical protein K2N13_08685 [Paraprevotella sp.]|nr:hypothetical protein [Paraprevotella sp.]